MKKVHDQRAKEILKSVAGSITRLETNREIPGHVLEADVWIEPDPAHESDLQTLGTLGRMNRNGPMLDRALLGCPSGQRGSLVHFEAVLTRPRAATRRQSRGRPYPTFSPALDHRPWAAPTASSRRWSCEPMEGWPAGCFRGPPFGAFHLIVVRKLPKSPETVLLRLLSRDQHFPRCLARPGQATRDLSGAGKAR